MHIPSSPVFTQSCCQLTLISWNQRCEIVAADLINNRHARSAQVIQCRFKILITAWYSKYGERSKRWAQNGCPNGFISAHGGFRNAICWKLFVRIYSSGAVHLSGQEIGQLMSVPVINDRAKCVNIGWRSTNTHTHTCSRWPATLGKFEQISRQTVSSAEQQQEVCGLWSGTLSADETSFGLFKDQISSLVLCKYAKNYHRSWKLAKLWIVSRKLVRNVVNCKENL